MKPSYKQTEVGLIPGDWEVKCLREVLSRLANGAVYQPTSSIGLPVTRIETIAEGNIDLTRVGNAARNPELEDYRMEPGDVLFSHINRACPRS